MNELVKLISIIGLACGMAYLSDVNSIEPKIHGDVFIDSPFEKNWYKDADVTFYTNYIHIENKESDVYTSAGTQVIVYHGEVQDD